MYSCRYKPNHIYKITPTVAPDVAEPVTLEEVKAWLTIDFMDDDAALTELIKQCRDGVEQYCIISMVEKTLVIAADLYEDFKIPYGPITAITGVMQRNGIVYEAYTGYSFDADACVFCPGTSGRFTITASAGPMDMVNYASLKLDLLRIIAYCWENRGDNPLTSLQGGAARPAGLDQALELFAFKYKDMSWL